MQGRGLPVRTLASLVPSGPRLPPCGLGGWSGRGAVSGAGASRAGALAGGQLSRSAGWCAAPTAPPAPLAPLHCCTGPSSVSLCALSFLRLSPGTASSSQRRLPAPASLAAGCGEDSGRTGRARLLPVCRARVRTEPRGLRGPPRAGPPARSSTQGEGQGSSRVFDSSPHVVRAVY